MFSNSPLDAGWALLDDLLQSSAALFQGKGQSVDSSAPCISTPPQSPGAPAHCSDGHPSANSRTLGATPGRDPPQESSERAKQDKQPVITTSFNLFADARVQSTGYGGLRDRTQGSTGGIALTDLVGEGSLHNFKYIPWDGRSCVPIVSADRYICGVLAGAPDFDDWEQDHVKAYQALEDARKHCHVQDKKGNDHRRGPFKFLRCGFSHGQGNEKPANHVNNKTNAGILKSLNAMRPFQRLAAFSTSIMSSWAPKLYSYYDDMMTAILSNNRSLLPNFSGSVFADATYNLGDQTVCNRHVDFQNLAFGWCAVSALGTFNHKLGGHLILWDYSLVIEFPPGSTILFPSAIIAHSNTPIGKEEKRYSFAQYTSAGLFRFWENGFRNRTQMSKDDKIAAVAIDGQRWEEGLKKLRKLPKSQTIPLF